MKTQAKRCTQAELAFLDHWRRMGYKIGINDPIPTSLFTPPGRSIRKPFRDAMLGCAIIIAGLAMIGFWLGQAAGIL